MNSDLLLDRIREVSLAEMRETPSPRPWRVVARWYTAAVVGLTVAALIISAALGLFEGARFGAQFLVVSILAVAQAMAIWVAVAPLSRTRVAICLALTALAIAVMLGVRPAEATQLSARPAWICSLTHLAVDIVPLAVALVALRQGVMRPGRVIAAGISAGALGALLGELACERGRAHVITHHLGVWLVVVIICMVVARRLRPRTFAP